MNVPDHRFQIIDEYERKPLSELIEIDKPLKDAHGRTYRLVYRCLICKAEFLRESSIENHYKRESLKEMKLRQAGK